MLASADAHVAPEALDLDQIERHLLNVQAYVCQFQSEIAKVKPEHRSVDLDFNHSKDYFKKLKFTFIELETKLKFLEHLQSGIADSYDEKTIERSVAEQKERIRDLKNKNEDIRVAITHLSGDLDQNFDRSREALGRLATLVEEIKAVRERVVQYRKTKHEPLYLGDTLVTLDNAQAILEEQVQKMIELEQQKQGRENEIAETDWKLTACNEEIQTLQRRLEEQTSALEALTTNQDEILLSSLREKKEWYDSTLTFVRKLSQMSVRFDEEQSKFFIDLSVWNAVMATPVPYTLCVDYNPDTAVIKGAKVLPQIQVPLEDIVEEAVARNNIEFLVREVRCRLRKHASINSEVEVLKDFYSIEWDSNNESINAIMSDGRICTLQIYDSFSGPGYTILVSNVQYAKENDAQYLQSKCEAAGTLQSLEKCLEICSNAS